MSTLDEKITFPGDVSIDRLRLYNKDEDHIDFSLGQATEILIYESIFAPCMFGSLTIADADAMIEKFPIVGGEALTIKLRTKTFNDNQDNIIYRSFVIVSIENRKLENDREQTYVLNFISIEGYTDMVNTISQAIPGDTEGAGAFNTARIAQNIFETFIATTGRVYLENAKSSLAIYDEHASDIQYVSNNWTPFQNMNYICAHMDEKTHPGSDNIFFETNKGFILTSIQGLISKQKDVVFDQYFVGGTAERKRTKQISFRSRDLIKEGFNDIEEMKIPKTIDIIQGNLSGYHASNVQAYDIYNKTRTHIDLDIEEDFEKYVHTDDGLPIPSHVARSSDSYTNFKILNGNTYAGIASGIFNKGKKTSEEKWVANNVRRSQYFNSFADYTFEIDVAGRTDIEVGAMIFLNYPSTKTKGSGGGIQDDLLLSGKYLVTAIQHRVNIATGHTMKMEIVKNGLGTK